MGNINYLYRSGKTVFNLHSLEIILGLKNPYSIRNAANRMIKRNELEAIRPGCRGLPNRNHYELANILVQTSYISLETVLSQNGIIFQSYQNTIFVVSPQSKNIFIPGSALNISYHRIKESVLLNPLGIKQVGQYSLASPERALCDRLYLTPNYYFDNLSNLDWDLCKEIADIYENKRLLYDIKKISNASRHKIT